MAVETGASGLLIGGLRPADPFLETYLVRPGGATAFAVAPDDRITVTDVDGGQPAEVTVLGADGSDALGGDRRRRRRARHGAPVAHHLGGLRGDRRDPRPRGPRVEPHGGDGPATVRRMGAGRRGDDVRRRPSRRTGGRRAGRTRGGRRTATVGPPRGGPPHHPSVARGDGAPTAARRATARLPHRPVDGALLRGPRGRVRPDHRCRGATVLGLPGVPPPEARGSGPGTGPRCHGHADADGQRVPHARTLRQVLRRRHGCARGGRARHGRAARYLRPRLQRQVLRGHGVPRARQLHGQLQRGARAVRDPPPSRLARPEPLLQHVVQRGQRPGLR